MDSKADTFCYIWTKSFCTATKCIETGRKYFPHLKTVNFLNKLKKITKTIEYLEKMSRGIFGKIGEENTQKKKYTALNLISNF